MSSVRGSSSSIRRLVNPNKKPKPWDAQDVANALPANAKAALDNAAMQINLQRLLKEAREKNTLEGYRIQRMEDLSRDLLEIILNIPSQAIQNAIHPVGFAVPRHPGIVYRGSTNPLSKKYDGFGWMIDQDTKDFRIGIWKEGVFEHGYGRRTTSEGIFVGEMKENKLDGWGYALYPNNSGLVEGLWENDRVVCGNGTMQSPDGYYSGTWKNGEFSGRVKKTVNGEIYEGLMENDKFHGEGRCTYQNGDFHEGKWIEGKFTFTGKVKITYENGSTYKGQMKAGAFHGKGTLTYKSGNFNKGFWDKNRLVYVIASKTMEEGSIISG